MVVGALVATIGFSNPASAFGPYYHPDYDCATCHQAALLDLHATDYVQLGDSCLVYQPDIALILVEDWCYQDITVEEPTVATSIWPGFDVDDMILAAKLGYVAGSYYERVFSPQQGCDAGYEADLRRGSLINIGLVTFNVEPVAAEESFVDELKDVFYLNLKGMREHWFYLLAVSSLSLLAARMINRRK